MLIVIVFFLFLVVYILTIRDRKYHDIIILILIKEFICLSSNLSHLSIFFVDMDGHIFFLSYWCRIKRNFKVVNLLSSTINVQSKFSHSFKLTCYISDTLLTCPKLNYLERVNSKIPLLPAPRLWGVRVMMWSMD